MMEMQAARNRMVKMNIPTTPMDLRRANDIFKNDTWRPNRFDHLIIIRGRVDLEGEGVK